LRSREVRTVSKQTHEDTPSAFAIAWIGGGLSGVAGGVALVAENLIPVGDTATIGATALIGLVSLVAGYHRLPDAREVADAVEESGSR